MNVLHKVKGLSIKVVHLKILHRNLIGLIIAFTLLPYPAILILKSINNPPDNKGCYLYYTGLEREWLNSPGARRQGVKDINNDDVMAYVDGVCYLERVFEPLTRGEEVLLEDIIPAHQAYITAHKNVCAYYPRSCLLTTPGIANLRLWLSLATLNQQTLDRDYEVETSLLGPDEVLVIYQHYSRTSQQTQSGKEIYTTKNIAIRRICPWEMSKADWSKCPLDRINYNTHRENSITGRSYDRYGLILDSWNYILYRRP